MNDPYDVGQGYETKGTFEDLDGALADPTTITLKVKKPDGTSSTYTYAATQVSRASLGIYVKQVTLDQPGVWTFRWEGTGTVVTAREELVVVRRSAF